MVSPDGRERDFDGVVESAARKPFEACAVGTHAPDARAESFVVPAVFRVDVEAVAAVGEVEPAVGPEDRAVQTGRVRATSSSR